MVCNASLAIPFTSFTLYLLVLAASPFHIPYYLPRSSNAQQQVLEEEYIVPVERVRWERWLSRILPINDNSYALIPNILIRAFLYLDFTIYGSYIHVEAKQEVLHKRSWRFTMVTWISPSLVLFSNCRGFKYQSFIYCVIYSLLVTTLVYT